ncbi:(2,3-dihydroxybenzoyl)adenylate synthase [Vibrio agarivorans]|uniref:Vibriobactin-specific 2,3-dihydroxybenzoate-AMP ligase n=2 Tax=Vibrio sagamiensis TaxID=512650 RepID=A0A511QC63_9VIBR|nr:(2,3-dihydroxybenzoyl)adenylate synthase [Vibrio agarivorans]GEM74787.1 vibriobactin-specific 2,3-dihydroxybenzoate-AMP ligase [Vibrio sagamiensis NBRC 104589]
MSSSDMSLDWTPWPETFATRYCEEGYWTSQTLPEMLELTAKKHPHKVAIIDQHGQWTYQIFKQQVDQLATGFQQRLQLQAGDKAVIHLTNTAAFYFSFFALLKIGVQPVLALPAHRYAEIQYFCHFSKAKVLITEQQAGVDMVAITQRVASHTPSLENVVWAGGGQTPAEATTLHSLLLPDIELDAQRPPDFAFFQLSGGTTGTPKLIPRTHADYLYSVRASNQICQFSSETRYLCVLPAAHNFPLSSPGALGCFMAGGTVVMCPDPSPATAFHLIEKYRINVAALVPPLAALWLEEAAQTQCDLSSLAVLQVGGARFSPAVAKRVQPELGCVLQQVFGMAEGLVNYTRLDDPESIITQTQGRPMSAADEVLVLDELGHAVPVGSAGRLFTRGPYTIRGYYQAYEHNQEVFDGEGFYCTGDIVIQDQDGNLQVVGRDKAQINRGGEKVASEEIEHHLIEHPAVHDAAVFAIADDFLGERSCAALVSRHSSLKPIEIKRFLREKGVADFKIPDRIVFVDSLPKTPVGKVNKSKLLEVI